MTPAQTATRIERTAWIAIYAGVFSIILAVVFAGANRTAAWSLGVLGCMAVIAGIVLIIVRSRMPEPSPEGKP